MDGSSFDYFPKLNRFRTERQAAIDHFNDLLNCGWFFRAGIHEIKPIPEFILEHYPEAEEILWEVEQDIRAEQEHQRSWRQPL